MRKPKTPQEQFAFLVDRVAEYMAKHIRDKVPRSGKFQPFSVSFDIPGTGNKGYLFIEASLTGSPEHRRLRIGVCQANSDRLISNYLLHDTNDNILEYLTKETVVDELLELYKHLSDRADKD